MPDVETMLNRLQSMRAELLELQGIRDEGAGTVTLDQSRTGRLSRMDALQRQAMAQHGRQRAEQELRRIDLAIRRCHDGSYGSCLECGEAITAGRLEADPAAELCIACARARD
jgi:DnaK suppressor protein